MGEKQLHVTMPDGSVWTVPARLVAEKRATFYAEKRTGATKGVVDEQEYREEFELTMSNPHVLIDWAKDNMNWEDVAAEAMQVNGPPAPDYQEGWVNGPMAVVDA